MWGNPDAPNPLSVLISLRLRPSFFSRSISSAAALSYHVPFPIICESRPVDAITYPSYHKFGATYSLKFTEIWIEFIPITLIIVISVLTIMNMISFEDFI
jgi:hypothetical protein